MRMFFEIVLHKIFRKFVFNSNAISPYQKNLVLIVIHENLLLVTEFCKKKYEYK